MGSSTLSTLGLRPAQIPTGMAMATDMKAAASTWTRGLQGKLPHPDETDHEKRSPGKYGQTNPLQPPADHGGDEDEDRPGDGEDEEITPG